MKHSGRLLGRSVTLFLWMATGAFLPEGGLLTPERAEAIPAFARRYEISCHSCHEYRYPRLNAFGKRFRENGFQLPRGGEDPIRARRMVEPGTSAERLTLFKEMPLSFRGQVFGIVPRDAEAQGRPLYSNQLFSFLMGGGSVAEDVSFFFSWTPFPDSLLHHLRVGLHNIAEERLGSGSLNIRAGALFLLDFQRPSHRFLAPGPAPAGGVTVGRNLFRLDDANLGIELYGRPKWGPLLYEVALVAGDPGETETDRDDWKDLFGRLSYIFFQNSDHEVTLGTFGYLGRSDIVGDIGGIDLAQRDDFWIGGADIEIDIERFNLFAMGYFRHDGDPLPTGESVDLAALRIEGIWGITRRLVSSIRYEEVFSSDEESVRARQLIPYLSWEIATNVTVAAAWRQNLRDSAQSSGVLYLDAVF